MNDCLLCIYIYILFFLLSISTFSVTSISKLYMCYMDVIGCMFFVKYVISMVILLIFEYKLVPRPVSLVVEKHTQAAVDYTSVSLT